jgi:hypothetical protein
VDYEFLVLVLNQHPEATGRNAKPAQTTEQQQNLTNLNHPSELAALTLIVNLIPPPQPDQYPSTDILHDPSQLLQGAL